jgi:gamma-glutamylcyclotransferase (GGCT)/AIG2-like uncharacterized protein YtfP
LLIDTDNVHTVTGEIYHLSKPEKVFAALDDYEGQEYSRELHTVMSAEQKEIRCWVYVYQYKPQPKHTRILNGDYIAYIRNKANNG